MTLQLHPGGGRSRGIYPEAMVDAVPQSRDSEQCHGALISSLSLHPCPSVNRQEVTRLAGLRKMLNEVARVAASPPREFVRRSIRRSIRRAYDAL